MTTLSTISVQTVLPAFLEKFKITVAASMTLASIVQFTVEKILLDYLGIVYQINVAKMSPSTLFAKIGSKIEDSVC